MRFPTIRIALCLIVAVAAAKTAPADGETLFQPKHIAQLKYVSGTSASPNGKQIAYTLSVPRKPIDDDDGPAWSELHLIDTDGSSRPFITGKVTISNPKWSTDGRWIFYSAKRGDDKNKILYRIAVDGGESIPTLVHSTSVSGFDISPNGKSVAFLATEETPKPIKELDDQGFDQEIYEEDWKPTRIWIADIDTGATAPDQDAKPRMLELEGSASEVQWSPDGERLMVVLSPTPSVDDSYMRKGVHIVDAMSGKMIRSLGNVGKLGEVAWSPDGERLALITGEDINDPREGRLMVVKIGDNKGMTDLLPNYEAHVNHIAWKDNNSIYWLAAERVSSRFGVVDLKGQRKDLIQPGEDEVLSSFSKAAETEVMAFLGHSANHPTEVFLAERPSDVPKRLTDTNPWLDEMRFAKQEPVRWKAQDGLEIEGILMYPLDYDKSKSYPTIMYVHGGPESHESNGWITSYSRPGQVAAARGFAVFYPNYRGSTGRGVAYSKLGQADAAGKEFDDLVDGIDYLVEQGVTERKAVGVTGGSYGGYASAWCSTYYSKRFAASVMFVGISDNVSKVGTTDIPDEMFLVHHLKHLWDDWDYFLERSPIRYVERNETPTLILHGKNDPRVHPSQSLELHRHLKTLGQAPVRLVLYEGEGHGNRKAAAKLDYNLRMLRWMEHFLKDKADKAPEMRLDYRKALGIEEEK